MDGLIELTDEMMPERYEPNWEALAEAGDSEAQFMEDAFYLLRETTHWFAILTGLPLANPTIRNEAINRGLLVRITKLLRLTVRELHSQETFLQLGIARDVIETVATLFYLLDDTGDGARYDQYVMNSLIAEREMVRDIKSNIQSRNNSVLDIEERMMRSIERTAAAAGIDDVTSIPSRAQVGFPNAEARVRLLGPSAYVAYRAGSSEVHGDWTDVYRNHLEYENGNFSPNFNSLHVRPQVPLMLARLSLEIVIRHLEKLTVSRDAVTVLLEPLKDLVERVKKVDLMHEELLEGL
ncbi:DUF5677 domain-containing protein [Amycolatopsis sp. cmx-4-68]|uniref:DUF5677 domain-containing protein n=1 Tax=Amycolatopsis sp. cmx-4-68 TaxID=2790938 RepID=UPI00397D81D1